MSTLQVCLLIVSQCNQPRMDDDKNNKPSDIQISAMEVHGQLTDISNDIKQMDSLIELLMKVT